MAHKRKSEAFKSNIPWENVSASTLRVVCRDLAGPSPAAALRTKENVISFLWDIEQHGCEYILDTAIYCPIRWCYLLSHIHFATLCGHRVPSLVHPLN